MNAACDPNAGPGILSALLDKKAEIDAVDPTGSTALHLAAGGGGIGCVEVLLYSNVVPNHELPDHLIIWITV